MSLSWRSHKLVLNSTAYNQQKNRDAEAYYDLLYESQEIEADGRTVIRLSGNVVKEVIRTKQGERVKVVPVGLTLALPPRLVPKGAMAGDLIHWELSEFEEVRHAVEAGPLILEGGKSCV